MLVHFWKEKDMSSTILGSDSIFVHRRGAFIWNYWKLCLKDFAPGKRAPKIRVKLSKDFWIWKGEYRKFEISSMEIGNFQDGRFRSQQSAFARKIQINFFEFLLFAFSQNCMKSSSSSAPFGTRSWQLILPLRGSWWILEDIKKQLDMSSIQTND